MAALLTAINQTNALILQQNLRIGAWENQDILLGEPDDETPPVFRHLDVAHHTEKIGATFFPSRNAIAHLLPEIKTPLYSRRGKTIGKSIVLDFPPPSQSKNGGAPLFDGTVTIDREETTTLHLHLPQIVRLESPIARYRGRLLKLHFLSA